jgi:CRP-like cAMP-binding protein
MLLRDGDSADSVFLVKSGRLKAFKNEGPNEVVLGYINAGEFVGEMAYIHGEARSANVVSLTECELIEIPNDCLDSVLFSKPAWAKALVKTLSSRLKQANADKSQL